MKSKKEKKSEKSKRKYLLMFKWLETMLYEKKPKFRTFEKRTQVL